MPTDRLDGSGQSSKISGVSRSWPLPQLETSIFARPSDRIAFQAEGETGQRFYGLLEPGSPPGHHTLHLVERPVTLGTLLLDLHQPDLPDGAFIRVDNLARSGTDLILMEPVIRSKQGRVQLPLGGLVPGNYKLQLALENAGPVGLKTEHYEQRVDAGGEYTVELEAFAGGLIELSATADNPPDGRVFAIAGIRAKGAQAWEPLWVTTKTPSGGILFGSSVLIDASTSLSTSLSSPIPAGQYEIQLSLEDHRTEIRSVQLSAGITEKLKVHLLGS